MEKQITLSTNKKLSFNYKIVETFECGIVLTGTEVKSIRLRSFSITEAYCSFNENMLLVKNMHIKKYEKGTLFNHEELRDRALLVHKNELIRIKSKIKEKGLTLVPSKVYLKGGLIKIEVCLCEGKKLYDKRMTLKEKELLKEKRKIHEKMSPLRQRKS